MYAVKAITLQLITYNIIVTYYIFSMYYSL